jgi:outer membrane protein assembly factor BamB
MFAHDPLHSGVSPNATIGASHVPAAAPRWSATIGTGDAPVYSSPAVAYDGALGEALVYEVNGAGVTDAFNAATGHLVWTQDVGGSVQSSPAVAGITVYFGDVNGILWALNATTGAVQCSFRLPIVPPEDVPGRVQASPVVGQVDGTGPVVFFGDEGERETVNAGHEWAVTGVGNTAGACRQKWAFNGFADKGSGKVQSGSWSSPALVKDRAGTWLLLFGSTNPDDAVYALDAQTGAEVWRFQTLSKGFDLDVGAGPTISAPGVNGFGNGVVYIEGKDDIEYALNLSTGAEDWSFNLAAASGITDVNAESVADLVGNTLYQAYAGYVYAFNASTGAKRWRTAARVGIPFASPSISGAPGEQVLFIGDLSGGEHAFRLRDGAPVWSVHEAAPVISTVAVADNLIYFAAGPTLYAFAPHG